MPTNTVVPTSGSVIYVIRGGDTLLRIARQYGTTVQAIMQANNLSEDDLRLLRPGQELVIPVSADSVIGNDDNEVATPVPTAQTYIVQAGDTPIDIANRFNVSVDALLSFNGLTREDASRLRVGQTLLIPNGAGTQSGGDSIVVASVSVAPSSSGFRLDSPILRSPEDGTPMSCSSADSLIWTSAPFMAPGDKYILNLGFVTAIDSDGSEEVNWLLKQERDRNRTSWAMNNDYCALAPQALGRQWRWYVVVANEDDLLVSPPSDIWRFTWN